MFGRKKDSGRDKRLHMSSVRIVCYSLVIATFIFTFTFAHTWGDHMKTVEAVSSTDVFKSFDLETLDGDHFTSDQLADAQITLFNVWSTDCAPCIMEMPDLEALNNSYPEGQIQIVGLVSDSVDSYGSVVPAHIEDANSLVSRTGVTYPSLILNEDFYAFCQTSIVGTPTTFYVNSDGEIIETVTGRQDYSQMTAKVDSVLAQLNQPDAASEEGK